MTQTNDFKNLNLEELFEAAANPSRVVEVQSWINQENNKPLVNNIKGKNGESLLHWAAMCNLGLSMDLLNAGVDINVKDADNRTPLDWITERLYFVCIDSETAQSAEIKQNIIKISNYIGSSLINMGAKAKDPMSIWVLTGSWELVKAQYDKEPDSWLSIGPDNFSVMHFWPIAYFQSNEDKAFALNFFLEKNIDINRENDKGITPLYVAVEQWIVGRCPEEHIKLLVKKGANPNILTSQGSNCWSLVSSESKDMVKKLESIIDG